MGIAAAVLLVVTVVLWFTGTPGAIVTGWVGGWFLGSAQTARILGE